RFDPTLTGTLTVRASVPGEATTDPVLRLFDAAGNELAFDDDAAAGTRDSLLTLSVNGGQTYYIGVNGSSAAARAYDPVSGATAASALVIKTGPGGTPIGDVQITGSLKSLTGKTADLTGDLAATGSIAKLALRSAGGGKNVILGAGAPTSLLIGSVSDLSVHSAALIKAVKATQWVDADATPDVLEA